MERKTNSKNCSKPTAKTCCSSTKACGGHSTGDTKRKAQSTKSQATTRQPRTKSCS